MRFQSRFIGLGVAFALSIASATFMAVNGAQAIVVSGGINSTNANPAGAFVELDPNSNFTVGNDNFDLPNLYAFDENQNINIGGGGLALNVGSNIAPNTVVASHYVFFDPVDKRPLVNVDGFVIFDANIIGIATQQGTLLASDSFQNNLVTYLNPTLRGLESGDSVSINGSNSKRLDVFFAAGTPGDYVRVFTEFSPQAVNPVPLPAALPLYGTGLAIMGFIGWRRKQKKAAA